ncbi:MAG: hypothetical protein JWO13_2469 [Acidobacteriales bacterium]|nr:hypothetical protein [Terriglobales bacterium]
MRSMHRTLIAFAAVALLAAGTSFAQESGSGQTPGSAQVSTSDAGATSPIKNLFGENFMGRWNYSADVGASQEFNDNIFSTAAVRSSDTLSRFSLRLSASMQTRNFRFEAHYFPNYVMYNRYSDKNALTHQYDQRATYRISARTQLTSSITGTLTPSSSNSPFQFVNFGGSFLPVFHPDALQSNARIFSSRGDIAWQHSFSARNSVSVDFQGGVVKFKGENGAVLTAGNSQNTYTTGASLQWDNEFIPGKKLGVQLGDSYFGFMSPASHSHYQYAKARYSQRITNTIHLSFGAGPSYRQDQGRGVIPAGSHPSFALDAELTSNSPSHSLGVSYNHGSQAGLTQGSLSSDGLTITGTRRINKRWNSSAGMSYSRSNTVNITPSSTTSYAVNGGLNYMVSPNLNFNAGYAYLNQSSSLVGPIAQDFDRNIFTIGLRYVFRVAGTGK